MTFARGLMEMDSLLSAQAQISISLADFFTKEA